MALERSLCLYSSLAPICHLGFAVRRPPQHQPPNFASHCSTKVMDELASSERRRPIYRVAGIWAYHFVATMCARGRRIAAVVVRRVGHAATHQRDLAPAVGRALRYSLDSGIACCERGLRSQAALASAAAAGAATRMWQHALLIGMLRWCIVVPLPSSQHVPCQSHCVAHRTPHAATLRRASLVCFSVLAQCCCGATHP